ncbi:MAG: M67 family metallopeptidase [Pseudomonadota bacterium]
MKDGASTSSARTDFKVSAQALAAMQSAAQSAHPIEACGLLLGEGTQITHFTETRNVHPRPETHFEIDPQVLIDAYRDEREGGPQVLGYFHSHPTGDPAPSKTDRAQAAHDGKLWMIAGDGQVECWRDDPDGFHRVSYAIATG